ncbi:MAG: IS66 family transposase [Solirubrobacteraceae bacterium]
MQKPSSITSPYAPDVDEVRAWLERMLKSLRFMEVVTAIIALVTKFRDINAELVRRLAYLQRKRPKSETLERLERQLVLPLVGLVVPSPKPKTKSDDKASRKGKHPGRHMPPAHLERVQVHNKVPDAMRICPMCGSKMTTVGHESCFVLNVIPARLVVEERIDETVACPKDNTIVSAPVPAAIVEKGKLGDTLIVEATADKFIEHIPVERQCTRFARMGVDVAPQTLGRSVGACIDLLEPVAKLIEAQTRGPGLLGTDATGLPVLDPATQQGIRTGAIWAWTNALWVTFFYSPSADSASVRRFLGDDLARTVQCDGTKTLDFLEKKGGKRPGCWSHGRRGFVDAARSGDKLALEALHIIKGIFAVEKASSAAGDNAEQRRARRQDKTKPIIDELYTWVDTQRAVVPPKTALGKALGYLHRQKPRLLLFLDDGNVEATNNRRERLLRWLILGRKNWLFTWLDYGGERTAHILSIIATCIAHDVNPRAYLHLVTKLIVRGWPHSKLRDLLPDRIIASHPELFVGERDSLRVLEAPALNA